MAKRYSLSWAKANLFRLVNEAEEGARIELTRRGKTVVNLVSIEDFERLSNGTPGFWEAYKKFRREFDLEELDINPDEIFGNVRDPARPERAKFD